jgi:GNAT superfamily N-acetyltransferase
MAKNIHLFGEALLFERIINDINSIDIFLIGYLTNLTTIIIGYAVLTKEHFIQIVIAKEYQRRGIATAIIAQLIEIYYARYFTNYNKYTMYINGTKNEFMYNIANKLQFNEHNHIWQKKCKNHKNPTLDKIMNHKILTYKIITSNIIKLRLILNNLFNNFAKHIFTFII